MERMISKFIKKTDKNPSIKIPNFGSFERDPVRFRYDAYLEEFRALRQEILDRLNIQERMINYMILLWAGLLTSLSLFNEELFTKIQIFFSNYPFVLLIISTLSRFYDGIS